MKRRLIASLLLSVLLISATVFSASAEGYSITIDNAVVGRTYTLYKIFRLNYAQSAEQYNYTVETGWSSFFENGAGKDYISLNNGHPNWIKKDADGNASASDVRTFSQAALAYAEDTANHVSSIAHSTAATSTVVFDGLEPGYYLVQSDRGYLCILDTVENSNITIEEKNSPPTLTKQVSTDPSTNAAYSSENSASIGDILYFRATIAVGAGTTNYVFHDYSDAGITLNQNSEAITVEGSKNGTEFTKAVDNTDYTLHTNPTNCQALAGCQFEIALDNNYISTVSYIRISYSGMLNKNAAVSGAVTGAENKNSARLVYNSGYVDSHTSTKTYGFDLIKENASKDRLTGAEFELYDSSGNLIQLVLDSDGNYRPKTMVDTAINTVKIVSNATHVRITGLKSGTYSLKETKAPDGYNKMQTAQSFTIGTSSLFETTDDSSGIRILNQQGTQLPSTGGMGTTIFYVLGGCLAVVALVLLIVKKRMDREA